MIKNKLISFLSLGLLFTLSHCAPSPEDVCKAVQQMTVRCSKGDANGKMSDDAVKGCVKEFENLAQKKPNEAKTLRKELKECTAKSDCNETATCIQGVSKKAQEANTPSIDEACQAGKKVFDRCGKPEQKWEDRQLNMCKDDLAKVAAKNAASAASFQRKLMICDQIQECEKATLCVMMMAVDAGKEAK